MKYKEFVIISNIRKEFYADVDKESEAIIVLGKEHEFTVLSDDKRIYMFTVPAPAFNAENLLPSGWKLEYSGGKSALVFEKEKTAKTPVQVAEAIISAVNNIEKELLKWKSN